MPLAPADSAVRVALEATFRQRAYDRTLRETLWSRALAWIGERLDALMRAAERSPRVGWTIVGLLVALALTAAARAVYVARQRREAAGAAPRVARGAVASADPWHAALGLAAAGDFTAAAHALYAALLARLAQRERLARHPSKTAGDYARDLRALGSRAYAPFRQFARDYDRVVYGLGTCDAPQFARLLDAANGVLPLAGERAEGARRG